MKKIQHNYSLPPIKINNNSSKSKIKAFHHSKTINNIYTKNNSNEKRINNIQIYVRCLPLSFTDNKLSQNKIVFIKNNKEIILNDPIDYKCKSNRVFNHTFDFIFDKNTNHDILFDNNIKNMINELFEGAKINIINFGSNSLRETNNLLGNETNSGTIFLMLREIFARINWLKNREYILKFCYYEIYNNNIHDLLKFNKVKNEFLEMEEHSEKDFIINDITEMRVDNITDLFRFLKKGNMYKTKEVISNIILQITLEYKEKNNKENDSEIKISKLNFIDLGRIDSLKKGNINSNFLTCGNCIDNFYEPSDKKCINIQHKDSNLIKILKDFLDKNSKVILIANISPSISSFEDTYNILRYTESFNKIINRNDLISKLFQIKNNIINSNNSNKEVRQIKEQLNQKEENIMDKEVKNSNPHFKINNKNHKNQYKNSSNNLNSNTFYYIENFQQVQQFKTYIDYPQNNDQSKNNKIEPITKEEKEFNDLILEFRSICDSQVIIKQKIIKIQRELDILRNQNKKNDIFMNLEKDLMINTNKYKEFSSQIETIYDKEKNNENRTELQKYFLSLIMKNSSHRIQMIDNKYYNLLNITKINIQEEYIDKLEKQIQYRDAILAENMININKIVKHNIRELKSLREVYVEKNKINLINIPKNTQLININNINLSEKKINNRFPVYYERNNIKNNFWNDYIKNKQQNNKNILIDKTINNSIDNKKKDILLELFKNNAKFIKKNLISNKRGNGLRETQNLSCLDILKGNTSNNDIIYSNRTYDSDYIHINKNLRINKSNLDKTLTKKKLLVNYNPTNKNIYKM